MLKTIQLKKPSEFIKEAQEGTYSETSYFNHSLWAIMDILDELDERLKKLEEKNA